MLNSEASTVLTHVEAGTPLGRFFRRYWIPAAKLEEIALPGGAPARVRLLGEALVAYRDPAGKVGLIHEFCPHRGASLAYARNEEGGLRCLYHGWKTNVCGWVVDTPAEPKTSKLGEDVRHRAYPVREAGGLLWTYMGPPDLEPPFPAFPWLDLPSSQLLVVKMYQDCNYLQGLEGDLDHAHPNYLHRDFAAWEGAGWKSVLHLMADGAPAIVCEETPYLMRVGAVRKTDDPNMSYVRTFEWVAPFFTYVASGPHESRLFKAWLPIDNVSCYTFYIHYDPHEALDIPGIYANWGHRTEPPHYRTPHSVANMHFQDRRRMATGNFSGIEGAAIQDRAIQESMGPIYDRTKEHLGTSDMAVVFYRRLMLRKIADMEQGKPLPAHDPGLDFRQRGASWYTPADRPWQETLRRQEQHEAENPKAAAKA